MRRALAWCLLLAASCSSESGSGPPTAAKTAAVGSSRVVALLVTAPGARSTDLVLQPVGAPAVQAAVASFSHPPYAVVRGAVLPHTRSVVAVADMEQRRDPSWGASLLRLDPGAPPRTLVDRVFHASRPLVLDDGRVFVERGSAGPELTPEQIKAGELRSDDLQIDEVDPATGNARTVYSWQGYVTYLAGAFDGELVVYRVRFHHADLVAVNESSGQLRVLAANIPAFARDFSVDEKSGALVYENRDPASGSWVAERLDIASGNVTRIAASPDMALAPHVWPGAGIVLNPTGARGLTRVAGTGASFAGPLGAGVDHVRSFSADTRWALVSHELPGRLPQPFALDVATGRTQTIAVGFGKRADIAGFVQ